jgi:hypothetical protein
MAALTEERLVIDEYAHAQVIAIKGAGDVVIVDA